MRCLVEAAIIADAHLCASVFILVLSLFCDKKRRRAQEEGQKANIRGATGPEGRSEGAPATRMSSKAFTAAMLMQHMAVLLSRRTSLHLRAWHDLASETVLDRLAKAANAPQVAVEGSSVPVWGQGQEEEEQEEGDGRGPLTCRSMFSSPVRLLLSLKLSSEPFRVE